MLSQAEFESLLQRYLDGLSLPGERERIEKWSEQLGREENLLLRQDLREEVRTAMWRRIVALTEEEEQTPLTASHGQDNSSPAASAWREPALRWAAAALFTLGAGGLGWWLAQQHPTSDPTPHQCLHRVNATPSPEMLRLADGTEVTLYPHSTLDYPACFTGARREVYLTGQGFFHVAKNPARPFLVYTDKLVTTVLGTSFLVTAYASQKPKVAVKEGRVSVQARLGAVLSATPAQPAATGVVLLPNQQVTYSARTAHLTKTLVEKPMPLTSLALTFRNRPVAEVLTALESAYGVNIVYDPAKLSTCTITISFGDEPLFEQLDALSKALDASYKIANNAQIIFESNGCTPSRQ